MTKNGIVGARLLFSTKTPTKTVAPSGAERLEISLDPKKSEIENFSQKGLPLM